MHRCRSALGALVLLAAACSADPPASESPESSPQAEAPSATASASAEPGVAELERTGEPLPPGRYTKTGFAPRITLELPEGWQAVQDASGFFDVQQRVGSPDVIAVQFANVLEVHGEDGARTPTGHADAAAILQANPDLTVLGTSESRIGGLTGSLVEVENAGEAHASVLEVPPGALGIDPGRRLWVALFDTDAGLLAIMVGGSVAEWQAALDAAEPVLESITVGR